ncbi:MAG: hypothetical protein NTV51_10555, partial [Verrucomicrobia bacterium]|nr:hypothetical protein [Verrucomicrobiota bacterium]
MPARRCGPVPFCDFASASNTWQEDSLYRVWQRLPLNVTKAPTSPTTRRTERGREIPLGGVDQRSISCICSKRRPACST